MENHGRHLEKTPVATSHQEPALLKRARQRRKESWANREATARLSSWEAGWG